MCVCVVRHWIIWSCAVYVRYDCLHTHINIPLLSLSKINKSFRLQHHPRRGETHAFNNIYLFKRWSQHCEWKEEDEIWKYLSLSSAKWYVFTSVCPTNESMRKTDHQRFFLSWCGFSKKFSFLKVSLEIIRLAELNIRKRITWSETFARFDFLNYNSAAACETTCIIKRRVAELDDWLKGKFTATSVRNFIFQLCALRVSRDAPLWYFAFNRFIIRFK